MTPISLMAQIPKAPFIPSLSATITENYLTYIGPKHQSKHLAKYLRCDDLWPGLFFASFLYLNFYFSKSKGQVISHVTRHVPSHVMGHGISHVTGQVINHVMADSCITCTWLVTQQLTERQALMTHRRGCCA
jgi:hypothetical protein